MISTKILANRLKHVLDLCIDEVQSAFVQGRLIYDIIIVAYEILCSLQKKRTSRYGSFALKLNMSKAYDRVTVLCQQGDPLSPYLFLLCNEGLSALLRLSAQNGSLKVKRPFMERTRLKTILNTYAVSSGQLVNFDKSNVFFSSNVSAAIRNVICTTLGVSSISCPETYLGLPAMSPPASDLSKIKHSDSTSCSGIVVRDNEGFVLGSCYRFNHGVTSNFQDETMDVLQGLLFALDLGLSKVVVETDAKIVYLKLASCELDRSEIGSHTRDIKTLALHFVSCSFSFISRNGNRVAHAMAVAGFQDGTDRFWVEDVPTSVLRVVS
ncbi:hypothetical protein GQ457_09G024480 [Hibiscus cannabinus]